MYVCMYNWRKHYEITNWTDCLVSFDDVYYLLNTATLDTDTLEKSFQAA